MKTFGLIVSFLLTLTVSLAQDAASPATQATAPAIRTDAELEQLLGPIALYPDALIALILPATTVPADIVLAARQMRGNNDDRSQVEARAWDDSVKSLTHYPDVLKWMDDNLDWTKQVGEAFTADPAAVMNAIQRLRTRARQAGTLIDTPQQQVIAEANVIRIVPAQPNVIYVPQYEPSVVYVDRPFYYSSPPITFGFGFPVGSWLAYDCDWTHRRVWVGDRHRRWHGHDWRRPLISTHAGHTVTPSVRYWQPRSGSVRPSVNVTTNQRTRIINPTSFRSGRSDQPRSAPTQSVNTNNPTRDFRPGSRRGLPDSNTVPTNNLPTQPVTTNNPTRDFRPGSRRGLPDPNLNAVATNNAPTQPVTTNNPTPGSRRVFPGRDITTAPTNNVITTVPTSNVASQPVTTDNASRGFRSGSRREIPGTNVATAPRGPDQAPSTPNVVRHRSAGSSRNSESHSRSLPNVIGSHSLPVAPPLPSVVSSMPGSTRRGNPSPNVAPRLPSQATPSLPTVVPSLPATVPSFSGAPPSQNSTRASNPHPGRNQGSDAGGRPHPRRGGRQQSE